MSDLIVEISHIHKMSVHPNPECTNLEIAHVKGWEVVTGKSNGWKVGDKVVYFPVDSIIPVKWTDKWGITKYLRKLPQHHVRSNTARKLIAAKLQGVCSFGYIERPEIDWPEGVNVKDFYEVEKFEPDPEYIREDTEKDNSLFFKYCDIQNIKNFPNIFTKEDVVVVTEKGHGCLRHNTKISMSDGSKKVITSIKVGDYVLGVDKEGNTCSSKVINTFNNGQTKDWLNIKGKVKGCGSGSSCFSIFCTPSHKFYITNRKEYISAEELNKGDKVNYLRFKLKLNYLQEQVILGKLLGDGSLRFTGDSAMIIFCHEKNKVEYIDYTLKGFGGLASHYKYEQLSGYSTEMLRCQTICSDFIKEKFKSFIDGNNTKIVPEWVANELTPLSMAFWYMDDGSIEGLGRQEPRAEFAVCGFTEKDCQVLLKGLAKFGINGIYYQDAEKELKDGSKVKYSRIRLNADDAEKFFILVSPYITPCMQYKLPERHRGSKGYLPDYSKYDYKEFIVEQEITEIEVCNKEENIRSNRYDLETETHNYFANGILVHNCNSRVGYIKEGETKVLTAGSHYQQKKRPGELSGKDAGLYWFPLYDDRYKDGIEALLTSSLFEDNASVILYGEIIGKQDLKYGTDIDKEHGGKLLYRAFDLSLDGKYVDYDEFKALCLTYGIPMMPELYYGPWDESLIEKYTSGKTNIGADKEQIREGIVIKTVKEEGLIHGKLSKYNNGRRILKSISDDYTFRKGKKTENH